MLKTFHKVIAAVLLGFIISSNLVIAAGGLNTYSATFVRASSQRFTAADSSSLSITGNITVEFWAKITTLPSSGQIYSLVTKDDLNTQRSYWSDYYNNAGTRQLRFGISSNGSSNFVEVSFNYTFATSTWTHVAFVTTVANPNATKVEMFINGVSQGNGTPVQSGSGATSIFDGTANLSIGNYDAFSNYYDGQLDEIRIWNTARTSSEISSNYNTQISGSSSGLAGYWQLNNTLVDQTSNGNTLTNVNSVTFTTDVPFSGSLDLSFYFWQFWDF